MTQSIISTLVVYYKYLLLDRDFLFKSQYNKDLDKVSNIFAYIIDININSVQI